MKKLGVNIDHVATIRQARGTFEPDPARAAVICEEAGADSIVAHLREDRRHIQDADLDLIKRLINIRLNLEMAATEEMVQKALSVLPAQSTLVPEKREELTTEGGLDVIKNQRQIQKTVEALKKAGITASLFVDPEYDQIMASEQAGADAIELHTGAFAEAFLQNMHGEKLREIAEAVEAARTKTGMDVHAGHGLTYMNTSLIAGIPGIEEFNIGHSIISKSVTTGLNAAVKEMISIIEKAERKN